MARGNRNGNIASIGHERLTIWGAHRNVLGFSGSSPLSRFIHDDTPASSGDGDPALAGRRSDELVPECERAVTRIAQEDPDLAQLLHDHYARGIPEQTLATVRASTPHEVQNKLLSGQARIGAMLLFRRPPEDRCTTAAMQA